MNRQNPLPTVCGADWMPRQVVWYWEAYGIIKTNFKMQIGSSSSPVELLGMLAWWRNIFSKNLREFRWKWNTLLNSDTGTLSSKKAILLLPSHNLERQPIP